MNRIKMIFIVPAVTAVILVAPTLPAIATPPADSIVFVPDGNGVTYSCTGGPPFIHNGDDASMGNCAVEQVGPPAGLACDIPATITIVHDMHQLGVEGSRCH